MLDIVDIIRNTLNEHPYRIKVDFRRASTSCLSRYYRVFLITDDYEIRDITATAAELCGYRCNKNEELQVKGGNINGSYEIVSGIWDALKITARIPYSYTL